MSIILGLDIGGTSLKLGAWQRSGDGSSGHLHRLGWWPDLPVPQTAEGAAVADAIAGLVRTEAAGLAGQAIVLGIGSCGLIAGGVIFQSPNTPWQHVALAALLEARLDLPVYLINDADAFLIHALRTVRDTAGKSAIGITLGTGLGMAAWLNGRLLAGGTGISPEGGHVTLALDRAPANTGIPGSFESLVCSAAVMGYYAAAGGTECADPHELDSAALRGDHSARLAWEEFGRYLGAGLGSFVNLFSPDYILVGGGLARAHGQFSEAMHSALLRHKLAAFPLPEVRFLDDDPDAVAHGGACYAAAELGNHGSAAEAR
jgi:glucokinase